MDNFKDYGITHADAENMLDHGAKTVQTRGGEIIGENKEGIVQCEHQSDADDNDISKYFFHVSASKS